MDDKNMMENNKVPLKISKEIIEIILQDMADGVPYQQATVANGVSITTWHQWIKQGTQDLMYDVDTLEKYLVQSKARIECEEIKTCRENILNSEKGHPGAQWVLERKYWRHYSSSAANIDLAEDIERVKFEEQNDE